MTWFTKKVEVPLTNATKLVDAIQLWEVRWYSRYGEWNGNISPELEAFPTEADALTFADSLRNAFKLIRHTSGTRVTVERAR